MAVSSLSPRFIMSFYRFPNKEQKRLLDRECQYAMGEEMSLAVRAEYQDEILAHMRRMEVCILCFPCLSSRCYCSSLSFNIQTQTLANVHAIERQRQIKWFMRPYLLDFLIEAHQEFHLLPTTLFLAINILDRYCSRRDVHGRNFQLVGCTALLIAAKFGDKKERVPEIKDLVSLCERFYEGNLFVQMEWHILQTLEWSVGHPTVDGFLEMVTLYTGEEDDIELQHMATYIAELALFHAAFVSVPPSTLARSALALSRTILCRQSPSSALLSRGASIAGGASSGVIRWVQEYDVTVFHALVRYLSTSTQVLYQKYASPRHSRVAETLQAVLVQQARARAQAEAAMQARAREAEAAAAAAAVITAANTAARQYRHKTHGITPQAPFSPSSLPSLTTSSSPSFSTDSETDESAATTPEVASAESNARFHPSDGFSTEAEGITLPPHYPNQHPYARKPSQQQQHLAPQGHYVSHMQYLRHPHHAPERPHTYISPPITPHTLNPCEYGSQNLPSVANVSGIAPDMNVCIGDKGIAPCAAQQPPLYLQDPSTYNHNLILQQHRRRLEQQQYQHSQQHRQSVY